MCTTKTFTAVLKNPVPQSLPGGSSTFLDYGVQIAFPVGICPPIKNAHVIVRLAGTNPVQKEIRLPWALRVGNDYHGRELYCHRCASCQTFRTMIAVIGVVGDVPENQARS